ncbi:MAG: membrane protein insertase YidC [Gammaproteobacteria bacterium]|nr:membrane protein insertase YidC [Gammaproteobacteria bacterium]
MDNQRLLLFVALSLVLMLLFSAWQEQNAPAPAEQQTGLTSADPSAPSVAPSPPADGPTVLPAERPAVAESSTAPTVIGGQHILVETDVLRVEINTAGGEVSRAALLAYPWTMDDPEPVQLLDNRLPNLFIAQSGLVSTEGSAPDHHALYQAEKNEYRLGAGEDRLTVRLNWQSEDGVSVIKILTFHRDSYIIDVDFEVTSVDKPWRGRAYEQLQRTKVAERGQSTFIYTFMGGVVSSEWDPYEKVHFDDMASWKPEQSYSRGGWVAMLQHYFFSAWIPDADAPSHFYTKALADGRYLIGRSGAEQTVYAGDTAHFHSRLFVGPKVQERLEKIAPNLRLSVDYGVLDILAKPVFWLLNHIHSLVGNWGLAIILVTLIIKLLFYKLSQASYRSMAKMRLFAPRMKELKERYGDDRQKFSKAMMEIYKKEKINPLGGCLPMLVQIPVFIALYWVLLESVELRQAPFMLWIQDLSTKDPYYVLPVIMGLSMFIQQKLNPPPLDPIQQKIMSFLPLIFTVFFAFFPSGLVLYWVVNNLLSIAQQWYITRQIEDQAVGKGKT